MSHIYGDIFNGNTAIFEVLSISTATFPTIEFYGQIGLDNHADLTDSLIRKRGVVIERKEQGIRIHFFFLQEIGTGIEITLNRRYEVRYDYDNPGFSIGIVAFHMVKVNRRTALGKV